MTNAQPVFYGAADGKVFIKAGENLVAISPDGARTLARHLPRMAQLAEDFARHHIGEMADALIQRGFRWRLTQQGGELGQWVVVYPDDEYPITTPSDYATATQSLYAMLRMPS